MSRKFILYLRFKSYMNIFNMSLAHWPTSAEVRDLKRLLAKKLGIPRFRQKLLLAEDHSVCGDDESQVVPGTLQLLGFYK